MTRISGRKWGSVVPEYEQVRDAQADRRTFDNKGRRLIVFALPDTDCRPVCGDSFKSSHSQSPMMLLFWSRLRTEPLFDLMHVGRLGD